MCTQLIRNLQDEFTLLLLAPFCIPRMFTIGYARKLSVASANVGYFSKDLNWRGTDEHYHPIVLLEYLQQRTGPRRWPYHRVPSPHGPLSQ